jgi:hypothetical protein
MNQLAIVEDVRPTDITAAVEDEKDAHKRMRDTRRGDRHLPRPGDRHKGRSETQLAKLVVRRMAEYKVDALEAIYLIATMPISDNSAQNQVKLMAAKVLAFPEGPQAPIDGGIRGALDALNDAYHKDAPRIKSVRERIVTFETEPLAINAGE